MLFMKKETEKVIEKIVEDQNLKRYVLKKAFLLMFFCGITLGSSIRFFENMENWEDIFVGILMIIYSLWCFVVTVVEMQKIAIGNNKKDKAK